MQLPAPASHARRISLSLWQLGQAAVQSSFLKSLTVLTGGTILAQIIPFAVLPILSRLYTPDTFALLGLILMGAYFTGPLSTLGLEQAITLAPNRYRARALVTITALSALLFAILYTAVLLVFQKPLAARLDLGDSASWMFIVPFNLLIASFTSIANYWLLRKGRHSLQSSIKLAHAGTAALLGILFGLLGWRYGLLYAFTGAILVATSWGLWWCHRYQLRLLSLSHWRYLLRLLAAYRDFPLFSAIPTAFNYLATQLPLMIIAASYPLATTGHFSVTRNLLSGGVLLLGVCVGQIMLKHLQERIDAGQKLWPFFRQVMLGLIGISVIGGVMLYALGPMIFSIYLGSQWADSGHILRILAVSLPFVLTGASLASTLVAINRLRFMALWQGFYLVASGSLFLCTDLPFDVFLWRLVAMECAVYAIYTGLIVWQIRLYDRRLVGRAGLEPATTPL